MRNRAKCRACNTIIESLKDDDVVSCKCGDISIWSDREKLRSSAADYNNFIRVDDQDNEIPVKFIDEKKEEPSQRMSKKEALVLFEKMLKEMQNRLDYNMNVPVNHYDFCYYLSLIFSSIREA